MYFKSVEIENVGPIQQLKIDFPFDGERPKPIVVVGENGTGKSILLSHLVNCLVMGKALYYDDLDVEQGKVYKYRSPTYIKSGENYSYSSVRFTSGIEVQEMQLHVKKKDFEETFGYAPLRKIWRQFPADQASLFSGNFEAHSEIAEKFYQNSCCLFFPVNRFEEPAWLNIENLKYKANYSDLKRISRFSNRSIINISPLKRNQDWVLDVILDRQAYEQILTPPPVFGQVSPLDRMQRFHGFRGQSTNIYEGVIEIIRLILQETGNVRLGIGTRKNRQVSVMRDEKIWVPNLFQLSSGEVQLLNLFLSIIRDYDLSMGVLNNLDDIRGIAIIDEIDSNLHTTHQKEILPRLIESFPNVQFIVTTHSPLFLIGMEKILGSENFEILNMPSGERVVADDFSEFEAAYSAFKETAIHRKEIQFELEQNLLPIVFVEGDYDIRYIQAAAALHGKVELLSRIKLMIGDGFGNLDKIWRGYDNPMAEALSNKIILLYDCDTKKQNAERGLIYKNVIPSIAANPIRAGIENLFSSATISKVENAEPSFIDVAPETVRRVRGTQITTPMEKNVNKDEKGNLCEWLCANGNAEDFSEFRVIFDIIESIVNRR